MPTKNIYKEFLRDLFQSHPFEKYSRIPRMEELLRGSMLTGKSGLSGMARGVSYEKNKSFCSQLKKSYRFLNQKDWDDFEVGKRLFHKITSSWKEVVIAIDWTQLGHFMVLEACIVLEGRGIPFFVKRS